MIEDIKHFKTNWIDGMKISKEHFQNLQDYAENTAKDLTSIRIGKDGYGLLASHLSDHNEYIVTIDVHKSLKISIKKLRAITPNGTRVEITNFTPAVKEDVVVEQFADNKLEEGFVLLNVDQEDTVAFGEQNPKEMPPRYPYTTNRYFFTFVTANDLEKSGLAGNQLPIAKIIRENNALAAATDYIAPSTTLGTSEALIDFYNVAEAFLKMAERSSILIVQKINTKQSDNPIADAMHTVVDKLYAYLSQQITYVKWEEYEMHPKKLIEIIVSFAMAAATTHFRACFSITANAHCLCRTWHRFATSKFKLSFAELPARSQNVGSSAILFALQHNKIDVTHNSSIRMRRINFPPKKRCCRQKQLSQCIRSRDSECPLSAVRQSQEKA